MKKIIYLFSILLLGISAQAQFINYQGVARDNAGNILINQPIALRLSVLSGSAVGTAVFVETHATSTDAYGLFTLKIGQGTVVTGVFNNIAWSSTSFFLKVEIDPTGGTNYGLAGTTQFAAVPYSLHAKTADNGFSGNYNDLTNQPMLFDGAFGSLTGKPSTLAGYGITDAMNTSHAANGITNDNIANWDAAYSWGNHATAGYLTSFTESDPIFNSHPASGISGADIGNWTTAYSWGNHATAGYLTSFTETDPVFISHPASGITGADIGNWTTAYSWGNHATAGYLTSFMESDPVFLSHPASEISGADIGNWTTSYSWGNHATAGYLTSFTESDPIFISHPASGITGEDIGNWTIAYSWGNHATAGYLTSFTETDPVFGAWDKSSGIAIASSQVSDFETAVTNTPAVLANTAKNNYPTEDATKLAGIAAGAEVNVNADWNATSGDAQILNKPVGTNPGDMLYWNGTTWIAVPVGTTGQVLKLNDAIPTWTSSASLPSIITNEATGITTSTAISGGNISDGGAPIIARGVCWSQTPNPTIADNITVDGNGSSVYSSTITGLLPTTTYHIRSYASNSIGIAYGNELSFTTLTFYCGMSEIIINHLATNGVAPVDKSASYGTVTSIPGEPTKCWITKNLGATNQPTSSSDGTEAAAGWYWQFNRKQGYMHDGTTRTPATAWDATNDNLGATWVAANDPCTLELGIGWRIPTKSEWTNVDASGLWNGAGNSYTSGLKLHTAGQLNSADGSLSARATNGLYWSNLQQTSTNASILYMNSSNCYISGSVKANGLSVRCIKD